MNSQSRTSSPLTALPKLTADHLKLKMRLSPLLQVEDVLVRKLTPSGASSYSDGTHLAPLTNVPYAERSRRVRSEVVVNSASSWKGAFTKLMSNARGSFDSDRAIDWNDPEDPGVVLNACGEDMIQLWNDPVIKTLLEVQRLRLEDMAGL
jgi:guanine nucleotide-binding protein subunit alpha